MDEKAIVIQNHLLQGMPGRHIQYQYTEFLHKFRIEKEGVPTHWFYVSKELLDDSEPVILVNLVNIYHVTQTLCEATESKWLFMSNDGLNKVDENFPA